MSKLLQQCPVLKEMLESRTVSTQSGERIPMKSEIGLLHAEALYNTALHNRPSLVVEVGMACGVSSLAILTALRDSGQPGKLISIDPTQSTQWQGCGVEAVRRAGLRDRHELIEDFNYNALPRLLASGHKIDLGYIDGWHTFDYALLDFWYLDRMLKAGGIVVFNDCGWQAVDKVIRFVLSHRKYSEMDVGLPVQYQTRGRKREMLRLLAFGSKKDWYTRAEDRYFKKEADWEPTWNFFAPF